MSDAVLHSYANRAEALAIRFERLDAAEVLAPVADLLPQGPSRVLDVGAGTGRDAAWLASRGCRVTAVEPTAGLREAGERAHGSAIAWVDDRLPDLARISGRFDFVLVNGLWHHLGDAARSAAMTRLSDLSPGGGRMVISLRQGPGVEQDQIAPLRAEREIARAKKAGFDCIRQVAAFSHQADNRDAGVTWLWLGLRKVT